MQEHDRRTLRGTGVDVADVEDAGGDLLDRRERARVGRRSQRSTGAAT